MPIEIDPWPYRAAMLRLAVSILHHPQNAEDAVSQAMLQALRRSHTLRDPSAIKPWLLKITARCAYDLLRREKRRAVLRSAGFALCAALPLVSAFRPGAHPLLL